jgi:hypothetical protein
MAWEVPDHRKVFRVFKKREAGLEHTIKNGHSREKQWKAAERLREAKLKIFKSQFDRDSVLPASLYVPDAKAKVWEDMSVDDIIIMYTEKGSNGDGGQC